MSLLNKIYLIQIRKKIILLITISLLILYSIAFLTFQLSSKLSLKTQSESSKLGINNNDIQDNYLQSSSSSSQPYEIPQINFENFEDHVSQIEFSNATLIFNEIHNILKQKNSDLNPIGVSYLPVTIPYGTLLYHSNWNGQIPESFEWTALDYEFSYHFIDIPRIKLVQSNSKNGEQGNENGKRHKDDLLLSRSMKQQQNVKLKYKKGFSLQSKTDELLNLDETTKIFTKHSLKRSALYTLSKREERSTIDSNEKFSSNERKNKINIPTLLTFQVEKPLNKLLLLSGASASKLPTGEMDSQFILANLENYDNFDEDQLAKKICDWGVENGGLDGIVRLEIGYEIIMCDFHNKLKLISNNTLVDVNKMIGFPKETVSIDTDIDALDNSNTRSEMLDTFEAMSGFDHYLAGSRVYEGESKIIPDFSKFITVLNRTYLDPDTYTRRIYNIPHNVKQSILSDLADILKTSTDLYTTTNNWQLTTNRIVSKFGPMLQTLNSSFQMYHSYHHDSGILGQNLTTYTFNYIRRYLSEPTYLLIPENKKVAIWDYVSPIYPMRSNSDYLIWSSIEKVQEKIVSTIYDIFQLGKVLLHQYNPANLKSNFTQAELEDKINDITKELNSLLEYLNWSLFYRCKKLCDDGEICFVPTHGPGPIQTTKNRNLGFIIDDFGRKRIDPEGGVCIGYKDLL